MNRLYSLDYLRGLAALSILIYHMISWNYGLPSADSFLGKAGVYGVSIFYVLSGLTLYHVYFKKMYSHPNSVGHFFIKRIFRIYPLMWLVIIATLVISKEVPSMTTSILNFTGLFGILSPADYIGTGMWSIGNELAFYIFFPLIVFFAKKLRPGLVAFTILLFLVYCYFAFFIIPGQGVDWWSPYVNPLNQAFLFISGFLIGWLNIKLKNIPLIIIIVLSLIVWTLYPVAGDEKLLVIRFTRIVFTILSIAICIGFYGLTVKLPSFLHSVLSKLGEASYSVYLLHPIIAFSVGIVANKSGIKLSPFVRTSTTLATTLVLSYFVYITFERFFINKANAITKRKTLEPGL